MDFFHGFTMAVGPFVLCETNRYVLQLENPLTMNALSRFATASFPFVWAVMLLHVANDLMVEQRSVFKHATLEAPKLRIWRAFWNVWFRWKVACYYIRVYNDDTIQLCQHHLLYNTATHRGQTGRYIVNLSLHKLGIEY